MFASFKTKVITLFQLLLVIIYIVFEELIWEGIARPIYTYVHGLQVLQRIEHKVAQLNPSLVLIVFIFLLGSVEAFGLYAGVLFVSGKVVPGVILYISKIPLAAFTFWLFRVSEAKLMQFSWFKWIYERIMVLIDWLKSREIYLETKRRLRFFKVQFKQWRDAVKIKYFNKESAFVLKIKQLYQAIKTVLRKHPNEKK